jgi:hypothetical protein
MTARAEEVWLGGSSLREMLPLLPGKADRRKLMLFAAGCRRLLWEHIEEEERRETEVWELYADGRASADDAVLAREVYGGPGSGSSPQRGTLRWVILTAEEVAEGCANLAAGVADHPWARARWELRRRQCGLLRDVFGNPFRPVRIEPAWRTAAVLALAAAAYEECGPQGFLDPVRLAILADALEEAGCCDEGVLRHCREEAVHVRGCWVVDAVRA